MENIQHIIAKYLLIEKKNKFYSFNYTDIKLIYIELIFNEEKRYVQVILGSFSNCVDANFRKTRTC